MTFPKILLGFIRYLFCCDANNAVAMVTTNSKVVFFCILKIYCFGAYVLCNGDFLKCKLIGKQSHVLFLRFAANMLYTAKNNALLVIFHFFENFFFTVFFNFVYSFFFCKKYTRVAVTVCKVNLDRSIESIFIQCADSLQ